VHTYAVDKLHASVPVTQGQYWLLKYLADDKYRVKINLARELAVHSQVQLYSIAFSQLHAGLNHTEWFVQSLQIRHIR
jgi:hypothetical protein